MSQPFEGKNTQQSPLRILQLVLTLKIGGAERLVYDIVRLVDAGAVQPVVCCLNALGYFGEALQQEGYPVFVLNRVHGFDWSLITKLRRLIGEQGIDVIHAHQYTPYFYGMLAALSGMVHPPFKKPGIVYTQHGKTSYPERKKIKRTLINPLLNVFTEEIVTISESTKVSLSTYENFPARKIQVVYNGIEFERFLHPCDTTAKRHSLGVAPDAYLIGTVARLRPIKNHAMLLRAFQSVLKQLPNSYLLLIGDGPEQTNLEELVTSYNLNGRVMFLGNRHDVPDLLQILDIFVLSSWSEGTSVSLLEAMGVGLPVVATHVGGNPEVVDDGETGLLVPSNDDQRMADMLIELLQHPERRRQMGQAGQQRAFRMFSLNNMVRRYTELYRNAAR